MSCGGEHQPQGEWTKQLLLGAESRPPGDLQQDLLSQSVRVGSTGSKRRDQRQHFLHQTLFQHKAAHFTPITDNLESLRPHHHHLWSPSRVGHAPWWRPDGADGRRPVSEGVPLALDAGTGRVEGLPDADRVQSRLVGQFGQQL